MKKLTISFLGHDRPGIVSTVSQALCECNCNIVQVSQTILGGDFAGIFVVAAPDSLLEEELHQRLSQSLGSCGHDMSVLIRETAEKPWGEELKCEPYIVTATGEEDMPGLIAVMSKVFSRHSVNIESLQAIRKNAGTNFLFAFEVMVPEGEDVGRLRRELQSAGRSKNFLVSVQHRDIFEAMHRIRDF